MKIAQFRALVAAAFITFLTACVVPYYLAPTDPGVARLTQYDGYRALVHSNVLVALPLIWTLTACIGLAFFQNWGRYLYLGWVVFSIVITLAYGCRVSSPAEEFIGAIEGVVDGVIIAVAFLSPLSAQFGEARP